MALGTGQLIEESRDSKILPEDLWGAHSTIHLEEPVLVFLSDGAGVPLLEQAERRYEVLVVLSLEMKEIPLKGLKQVDDK